MGAPSLGSAINMMARTVGSILLAIAAVNMAQNDKNAGTDLLQVSSFAFLDGRGHLAYLTAKAHATKNAKPEHVMKAAKSCDKVRRSAFETCANKFCECQGATCDQNDLQ